MYKAIFILMAVPFMFPVIRRVMEIEKSEIFLVYVIPRVDVSRTSRRNIWKNLIIKSNNKDLSHSKTAGGL